MMNDAYEKMKNCMNCNYCKVIEIDEYDLLQCSFRGKMITPNENPRLTKCDHWELAEQENEFKNKYDDCCDEDILEVDWFENDFDLGADERCGEF